MHAVLGAALSLTLHSIIIRAVISIISFLQLMPFMEHLKISYLIQKAWKACLDWTTKVSLWLIIIVLLSLK